MRLFVTGGTGFIGRPLCQALVQAGHEVAVVTRAPEAQPRLAQGPGMATFVSWERGQWEGALAEAKGIINLAGESIAAHRWTPRQKLRLWESRVGLTHRLIEALSTSSRRPAVLLNASAVGYYGPRGDEELTETAGPGQDFLGQLCQAWEAEARRAEALGLRVVRLRIGLVLAADGGALAKLLPPFRAFLGGPLGSGRQWWSWIHREDVLELIQWALEHPDVSGPLNLTAPEPARMRELAAALGAALRRPAWLPAPSVALRLLLGEMAEVLVSGQRAMPAAALKGGYAFKYPHLQHALAACLAAQQGTP